MTTTEAVGAVNWSADVAAARPLTFGQMAGDTRKKTRDSRQWRNVGAAVATGYFTDGRFLVALDGKGEKAFQSVYAKLEAQDPGRFPGLYGTDIDAFHRAARMVTSFVDDHKTTPAYALAPPKMRATVGGDTFYHLPAADGVGPGAVVRGDLYETIARLHPGATFKRVSRRTQTISGWREGPVLAFSAGAMVGAILPTDIDPPA
jgi:hypothetical protein